jgi:flagellar biosynthesis/type III secretory pathway chaperone
MKCEAIGKDFGRIRDFSEKNPALGILFREMDIDQRLEKLTERHEALTQTVELVAHMQQKNEVLLAHVIESVDSLARIAHAHENRITGLEDSRQ